MPRMIHNREIPSCMASSLYPFARDIIWPIWVPNWTQVTHFWYHLLFVETGKELKSRISLAGGVPPRGPHVRTAKRLAQVCVYLICRFSWRFFWWSVRFVPPALTTHAEYFFLKLAILKIFRQKLDVLVFKLSLLSSGCFHACWLESQTHGNVFIQICHRVFHRQLDARVVHLSASSLKMLELYTCLSVKYFSVTANYLKERIVRGIVGLTCLVERRYVFVQRSIVAFCPPGVREIRQWYYVRKVVFHGRWYWFKNQKGVPECLPVSGKALTQTRTQYYYLVLVAATRHVSRGLRL